MSGRLTAPKGQGYQFFPHEEWKKEFAMASKLGLDTIELVVDENKYADHPLLTRDGRNALNEAVKKTGVKVNHVMMHIFVQNPFLTSNEKWFVESQKLFAEISSAAEQIGASSIEIPLLEGNSIISERDRNKFKIWLENIPPSSLLIGLETDLISEKLVELMIRLNNPRLRVVFDTGNSAATGLDPAKELYTLKNSLSNVHIKDRKLRGETKPLGEGDVNFDTLFTELKKIGYAGDLTLEAARGKEGAEKANMNTHLEFLKNYL